MLVNQREFKGVAVGEGLKSLIEFQRVARIFLNFKQNVRKKKDFWLILFSCIVGFLGAKFCGK